MKTIRFSKHYKKLLLASHLFTTIRSYNPEKEKYYKGSVGEVFRIGRTPFAFIGLPKGKVLVLLFKTFELGKAMLLQVFVSHHDELSEAFKEYDTEEASS